MRCIVRSTVVTPAKAGAQCPGGLCVRFRRYGTLYVGVTGDLLRRSIEHRQSLIPGFTKEHGRGRLVWYEPHEWIEAAIEREKRIKRWRRDWKVNLIQSMNPDWADLFSSLT